MIFYYCMDITKFDGIWWDAHVCQWLTPLLFCFYFSFFLSFFLFFHIHSRVPIRLDTPVSNSFWRVKPVFGIPRASLHLADGITHILSLFFIFYLCKKGRRGSNGKVRNCRSWNSVCPPSPLFFKSKRCVFSPLWLAVTFPLLSNSAPHLDPGRRPCEMKDPDMIKLRWPYTLL